MAVKFVKPNFCFNVDDFFRSACNLRCNELFPAMFLRCCQRCAVSIISGLVSPLRVPRQALANGDDVYEQGCAALRMF